MIRHPGRASQNAAMRRKMRKRITEQPCLDIRLYRNIPEIIFEIDIRVGLALLKNSMLDKMVKAIPEFPGCHRDRDIGINLRIKRF